MFWKLFTSKEPETPPRDIAALMQGHAAPAIHITLTASPSRSHFGGNPRLPQDVPWPAHHGKPLAFLARISLEELHRALAIDWLPTSGALLFFYDMDEQPWGFDPKDRGGWAVIPVPELASPVVAEDKSHSSVAPDTLLHRNMAFRQVQHYPSDERMGLKYSDLSKQQWEIFQSLADAPFGGKPRHQVSGFPSPVQNDDMQLACQLASNGVYCGNADGYKSEQAQHLKAGAVDWRLLLQFDTDDELDVMWGDVGMIYFFVPAPEARAGNFANAWLQLQCC